MQCDRTSAHQGNAQVTVIIGVSGWRGFVDPRDRDWIKDELKSWSFMLSNQGLKNDEVYWRLCDEKYGADSVAIECASEWSDPSCLYKADWNLPNSAGGPVRSLNMLKGKNHLDLHEGRRTDYLLAFPTPGKRLPRHDEVSGTWRAIEMAKDLGITWIVPGYTKPEPEALF